MDDGKKTADGKEERKKLASHLAALCRTRLGRAPQNLAAAIFAWLDQGLTADELRDFIEAAANERLAETPEQRYLLLREKVRGTKPERASRAGKTLKAVALALMSVPEWTNWMS